MSSDSDEQDYFESSYQSESGGDCDDYEDPVESDYEEYSNQEWFHDEEYQEQCPSKDDDNHIGYECCEQDSEVQRSVQSDSD